MRERPRATIGELRTAVQCLPRSTRIAMLEGIRTNDIIVGAYSTPEGICPMLAAHRAGGRTNLISFARSWDRFAFAHAGRRRARRARRATERELLILRTQLEASLLEDEAPSTEMEAAVADHRALAARARPGETHRAPRPGDPHRAPALENRPGWAWLQIFRRYDDYERALRRVHAQQAEIDPALPAMAGEDARAASSPAEPARLG